LSRFLAIDVDQTHVHVVAGVAKGGVTKLEAAATFPLKAPLSLVTAEDLGKDFREALKATRIVPAPVLVSLGRDRVIVKDAKIPQVPEAEEAAVVRFQASKDLTEAADAVVIDYYTLAKPDPDGQKRAVIVSFRKEYLEAYRQFCAAAGLKIAGVTPRPVGSLGALTRAIKTGDVTAPETKSASVAVLSRGDKWGELVIARDDQVVFSRAVSATALNAEAMLIGEIKRNLAVYNGQSPTPVEALFVAEASGPAGGWSGRLRAGLPVTVQAFDPLAGVEHATYPEARGQFAGLVGLLQLKSLPAALAVDFLAPREPKPPSRRAQNIAALAGFAALFLVLAGMGFGYYRVTQKDAEIATLVREKAEAEKALKDLEVDKKRIEAVKDWEDKRINWLDELYDMTDRFPNTKTTHLEQFRGEGREPEKGAKIKNVGRIVMKVQTSAEGAFGSLQSMLNSDGKYHDIVPQTRGGVGNRPGQTPMQAYELRADLERRQPNQYVRKMAEPPAKKPDRRGGDREESPKPGLGGGQFGAAPLGGFLGGPVNE
jgi:hypothetical protein